LSRLRVRMEKKPSTALSQEADVGVKWNTQRGHPGFGEPLLPAPHRGPANPDLGGDRQHRQPFRRKKDDPRPLNVLLRTVAIADDSGQSRAVLGSNNNGPCHARSFAWTARLVDPLITSVH
jgi:hypothetical protein